MGRWVERVERVELGGGRWPRARPAGRVVVDRGNPPSTDAAARLDAQDGPRPAVVDILSLSLSLSLQRRCAPPTKIAVFLDGKSIHTLNRYIRYIL